MTTTEPSITVQGVSAARAAIAAMGHEDEDAVLEALSEHLRSHGFFSVLGYLAEYAAEQILRALGRIGEAGEYDKEGISGETLGLSCPMSVQGFGVGQAMRQILQEFEYAEGVSARFSDSMVFMVKGDLGSMTVLALLEICQSLRDGTAEVTLKESAS